MFSLLFKSRGKRTDRPKAPPRPPGETRGTPPPIHAFALEPRILFDGAAAATAPEAVLPDAQQAGSDGPDTGRAGLHLA